MNICLSLAAYATGFVILFSYPVYFGIGSPADIILTPIGLVFILEIDNWAYDIMRTFYSESNTDELWIFHKSEFKEGSFEILRRRIWIIGLILYLMVTILAVCGIYSYVNANHPDDGLGTQAVTIGFFLLYASMTPLIAVFLVLFLCLF